MGNPNLDRDVSIGNGWQFQNGDKLLGFGMPPAIAMFGLGVAGQVKTSTLPLQTTSPRETSST